MGHWSGGVCGVTQPLSSAAYRGNLNCMAASCQVHVSTGNGRTRCGKCNNTGDRDFFPLSLAIVCPSLFVCLFLLVKNKNSAFDLKDLEPEVLALEGQYLKFDYTYRAVGNIWVARRPP
eukprot:EG_transcript_56487